jgi:ABC-type phosphate transport system auxiliary subunit
MTTSLNENASNEERKDIWVELQSFRQDTMALRTEAYRLRTAGRLDATANERLRTQQTELERRGEAIIKRCVHFLCYFFLAQTERTQIVARSRMASRSGIRYVANRLPFLNG